MSFKNILCALAPVSGKQAGIQFAVSMGEALGAHVTGCSYVLRPDVSGRGLPWFPEELVANLIAEGTKKAHLAVEEFRRVAKQTKVETTTEVLRANLDRSVTDFGEQARVHDVAVVTQSDSGIEHLGDLFAEAALFYSGRPIIVVPRDHAKPFCVDRVLIAWDGSQQAAKAVAQAMPLLKQAAKVEILVIGDKQKIERSHAPKIVTNLERHGLNVDLVCRDDLDDANAIAREAKVWGADLLVMGGYGHSRAREIFFGGVTRFMMSETPLPVLMAN